MTYFRRNGSWNGKGTTEFFMYAT